MAMLCVRLIFDRFDRPEAVVYKVETGMGSEYETPVLTIPLEKLKMWIKDLVQHEKEAREQREKDRKIKKGKK